jgi:hypothetical protein
MSDLDPLLIAILGTVAALALEHWFMRSVYQKPIPAPFGYIMGTVTLWAAFIYWAYRTHHHNAAWALTAIVLAAGVVALMYGAESIVAGQGERRRADFLDRKHTGEDDEAPSP